MPIGLVSRRALPFDYPWDKLFDADEHTICADLVLPCPRRSLIIARAP